MNEKDMSRRDFLKIVGISTATATAATLAGCGPKGAGNNEPGAGTVPVGKMDYRTNPKTGERVSLLGYGCMRWPTLPAPEKGGNVIDQDAVFVSSEIYGEVIKTRTFEDFCTEQDLRLWVCNKADPESKGPIENSVGFVKKNFFSARKVTCIDDVWRSLPGWLERKNQRIHRSTLRVPKTVYDSVEKSAMQPLLPSVYETSPNTFRTYEIAALPYVLYKSCRYSVPRDYAFKTVRFKVVSGKIHIYDDQLNYICSHNLSERKGSVNQLPEHRKQDSGDWIEIMERLRGKWNCYDFQHFINGVKKENPRHISKQLRAIEQFLDSENPDKSLVAQVMKECCQKYRYQFSQFKVVYGLAKAGRELATDDCRAQVPSGSVSYTDLSVYAKAFQERTERKEAAAR